MKHKKKRKPLLQYLPVYGCISTGLIYAAIGIIALLSFFKLKDGGADESNLVAFLNDYLAGRIFIWIILLGTISYIIWRVLESIKDPYDYGSGIKGIILRIGVALSTIPDLLIAYTASSSLFGNQKMEESGQPLKEQNMIRTIMDSWGSWIIIAVGIIIILTAIVQMAYGISKGYKERLDIDHYSRIKKSMVNIMAWAGYSSRGIIIGIIGVFLVKAGIENNAALVVNTDKAFDFVGDDVGHLFFILLAAGTICYGIFMFIMGLAYDADKD
jgi:heme/copper-type cytochrome/quinol oxidase subunit 2